LVDRCGGRNNGPDASGQLHHPPPDDDDDINLGANREPMTVAEAARCWADAWRQGWGALDPEPILARYSPDALLSTEPFRDPYRGLDGIRDYVTRALGEEEDPQVWMSAATPELSHGRAVIAR